MPLPDGAVIILDMDSENVCVFCGASQGTASDREKAFALGELLAEKGHTLVYGGSDLGLMGCVARGMKEKGGKVISIIPEFFLHRGVEDPHSDSSIHVPSMAVRKEKMIEMCDVFIALPGGIGTLDEIGEVLTTISLNHKKGKLILCDFDGFYQPLIAMLNQMKKRGYIAMEWNAEPLVATDISEVAALL